MPHQVWLSSHLTPVNFLGFEWYYFVSREPYDYVPTPAAVEEDTCFPVNSGSPNTIYIAQMIQRAGHGLAIQTQSSHLQACRARRRLVTLVWGYEIEQPPAAIPQPVLLISQHSEV